MAQGKVAELVIHQVTVGPFAENTYLIGHKESREAFLIDPGDEPEVILDLVRQGNWKVSQILNTHGHIDHVGAVHPIQQALNVPFLIHKGDEFLLDNLSQAAALFGLIPPQKPDIHQHLEEGQRFSLGSYEFQVLHVPGHSPGHVAFYTLGHAFVGDCLFQGSIGRTDLPGGDYEQLIRSIENKLFSLPEDTVVYPGHGPATTVKIEKETNPFFR